MQEEKFSDRLKRMGGCMWWLFGGFVLAGLFIMLVGVLMYLMYRGTEDAGMAIAFIIIGAMCDAFFIGIFLVLPYVQWKKGISVESNLAWQSGILTSAVIRKDARAHKKTKVIGWLVVAGTIAFLCILMTAMGEKDNPLWIAILPMLGMAVKEWICMGRVRNCRIEEDRVVGAEIKVTFDAVDAVTTHLPTKTPTLYFEKYGEYAVDSMHIHAYYSPEEILDCMDVNEEVLIVYSNRDNAIVHIYRKKYWTLEEK